MRKRDFLLVLADISAYQLESNRRREILDELIERFCGGVSCLDLNRHNLAVSLDDKLQLGIVVWLLVMERIAVFNKRFRNKIFVNSYFGKAF